MQYNLIPYATKAKGLKDWGLSFLQINLNNQNNLVW